jgi:hypothetical protein
MQTPMILTTSNAAVQRSTDYLPHTACWIQPEENGDGSMRLLPSSHPTRDVSPQPSRYPDNARTVVVDSTNLSAAIGDRRMTGFA